MIKGIQEGRAINKKDAFEDCVILSKESFDPEAVFYDDIVDDGVLPYLSLKVDGLNTRSDARKGQLELRPDDVAANDTAAADTRLPDLGPGDAALDVYGWESSWLRKLKAYLGR